MIRKIGVIYQDAVSRGFLEGLCARLGCQAELVEPPAAIGTTRDLPRKQARHAWEYFRKQQVDLVVRFTDADRERWQNVRRSEAQRIPSEAGSMWLCGVAVNCVEDWLALDVNYAARWLQVPADPLRNAQNRVGAMKSALAATPTESSCERSRKFVAEAPPDVFRRWLAQDSLRTFYDDCRAAASNAGCETRNEHDEAET